MVTPARDREALDQAIVRGSELLKQGKLDQALRAFHAALELEPDNTKVLALLGLAHFRGNQFAEARPIYEQLVDRAPTDASHRLNLGLVYLKLGDGDRAITALEASRALDPSQGRAVSYLGLAYARAGRYAEAYRSFLLADQRELASEVEIHLTPADRDGINSQLGRTPDGPVVPRTMTPPAIARSMTPAAGVAIPRTATPPAGVAIPRTATPPAGIAVPRTATPPAGIAVPRTATPPAGIAVPRTASAPAGVAATPSSGVPVVARTTSSGPTVGRSITPHVVPRATLDDPRGSRGRPPSAPPVRRPTESGPAAGDPFVLDEQVEPAPRMTESMQFVLPKRDPATAAVPRPMPGHSMVSMAVAAAAPSSPPPARTTAGGVPPRPLSELATEELVRPADGEEPIELAPEGNLVIRISDRVMTRLEGVHVTGGDLSYELATRRTRGHQTEERFDHGGAPLHVVTGNGYLIAVPGKYHFAAVALDDDILYLREDLVFAFEASLRWENGNVPGLRGKLPVVQFRGDGALALRLARPLVRVKLPPQGVVYVDADRLAGWIGRVIPRAVVPPSGGPMGAMCVECTGEGIVLVEPAPEPTAQATQAAQAAPAQSPPRDELRATPPPPPALSPAPEIPPELAQLGDDPDATADAIDRQLDEL
ncbi:MAG: tetratricopeptide repeat protein [Kofleriaceae bacterium]